MVQIPLRSILSAVVVAIYIPVLIFAIRIMASSKDPLRRWRTLLACILYRLAGSALFIPFGLPYQWTTQQYFKMLCFTLDVCSSWALTVCTAYLINIANEGESTQHGTEALRLPGNVMVVAIIPSVWAILFVVLDVLSIWPGGSISTSVPWLYIAPLGPLVIALVFIIVVWYAVRTRRFRFERMLHYRKRLLVLITVALPLIAVRTVYGILDVFSRYTDRLAVFDMFEGSPIIYFVMDVLMECVVVTIYTVAGTMLPLDEDYRLTDVDEYPFLRLQHLGGTENQL